MKILLYGLVLLSSINLYAQDLRIDKIEPPNWWNGHTYNEIQLMVYGEFLDSLQAESNNKDFQITKVHNPANTSYAFIDVKISDCAEEGEYKIKLFNKYGEHNLEYRLLERDNSENIHRGFSNHDVIYLIFPDRFVNGDQTNDLLFSDKEEFSFGDLNGRHGGDIAGIISKLDYLMELGITAIWSTPLVENNMYMSYHGYAATDLYKIDPRHGTNELYKKFVKEAHKRGIKVILDHVANHIGINHPWVSNVPTPTWINGKPGFHLPVEHDKSVYVDPYADSMSIRRANEGWFVDYMPDLNQRDTFLSKYIIQNTIWWIEYAGLDGIREDTYPYANPEFMSKWAKEILTHYPNFNIVGEVWKGEPAILAAFQGDSYFPNKINSNLPAVTDFALHDGIIEYLQGKRDLFAVYDVFAKDFVYSNPSNLLAFFDNHDTDRGMYAAGGNIFKYKVALTLILTTRGIPQLFYGAEIGLNDGGHHGRIREPFPGGFGDKPDAFEKSGRDATQNEIFSFTKALLKLRNENNVLKDGKFTQYLPRDGIYVYMRSNLEENILFIINDSHSISEVSLYKYVNSSKKIKEVKNLLNNSFIEVEDLIIKIEPESINIFNISY